MNDENNHYRYFLENSLQIYFLTKPTGEILECNKMACKVFGYSENEIKTLGRNGLIADDDALRQLLKEREKNGEAHGIVTGIKKNGENFPFELSGKVFLDEQSGEKRTIIIGQDISTRYTLEQQKSETEKELRRVMEAVNVGIVVHNERDEIIHFNQKALDLLGVTEDFLLGKTAEDNGWALLKENLQPYTFDEIPSTIARKEKRAVEGVVIGTKGKDGKITWLIVDAKPTFNSKGESIVIVSFADISSQKKLQHELQSTGTLLEQTNQHARIGGWAFDVNLQKLMWTSVTKAIHEVSEDFEPDIQTALKFYDPEYSRPQIEDAVQKLLQHGEPYAIELQITTEKGKKLWVKTSGNAEFNNGRCIRLYGTFQDIDEQKNREIALIENRAEIVQIYNTISDVVFKIEVERDDKYKFITVNDAFCKATGYSREDIEGHYSFEIIPEPSLSLVHEKYKEAIATKVSVEWEETTVYSGSEKTGIVRVSPMFNEHGICTHLIGNVHDVTEIKVAAKAAQESLNKLNHQKFALDQHSIVAVTDAKGSIIYVNDKFCEISGYTREELIGQNHRIVNSGVHPKSYFEEMYKTIYAGEVWHGDICNKRKDGSLYWVRTSIVPFKESNNSKPIQFIAIRTDITKEKENVTALQRSEEYLRTVFDYSITAILVADDHGKYLDVNPYACKLFGYSKEEMLNMSVKELRVASHHSNPASELYDEYLTKGIDQGEFHFYNKSGKLVNTLYQAIRVRENFNVSIMVDISDRMEYEQKIKSTQEFLEEIFNTVSDVIYVLDIENENRFKYVSINQSFSKYTGYSISERLNQYVDDVIPSPLREIEIEKYMLAIQTRKSVSFEISGLYPTGIRTAIITATPLFNENGKCYRMICSARDITDIIDSQNEIRKLSLIARETINGAVITDTRGKITWVNRAFEKITGYKLQEILGQKPGDFLQGEESDKAIIQLMHDRLHNKQPFDVEVLNYSKEGNPYWIKIQCQPMINSHGEHEGFFAIETDITQEKEIKIEREFLIKELTDNYNDLKQFTYITSHNLRAPLTNLVAISNLLELPEDTDDITKQLIEGFKVSTLRLNETLDDLIKILLIKESTQVSMQEINFARTLDRVTASLNMLIHENGVQITSDFSKAPGVVFSSAYVESIFLNLITNSIKYKSPHRRPHITIRSETTSNGTMVYFSDNGSGFDLKRVKNRVFGLYQRFHNNKDSKGIGLYLIKSQITALGGNIDVESEEDKGATFTLTFPA